MNLKLTSILCAVATVALIGTGCASKRANPADNNANVLDITPAPAPAPVAYTPAPAPVAQPIADASAVSSAGTKYTVQKGDTLWKISTTQYGDGKQWQKICSANPGLSPETLKAGQTIVIP